ncbi:AAA family ATPase [Amycolatopsis acidicola]|uniref:AAA family ATPase n=1 Tax=Amycolatopsis acidicola TaxID=2596893 RepID=A0A5N0UXQ9_9PSEU|nr:AAA family ATPase [Amycolatopsis acidicola]KAA9155533.1 AAA family ATPase [Amycolatopsis acidicola]
MRRSREATRYAGDTREAFRELGLTPDEAGCLKFGDDEEFPGFLHLWSDNPPGFLQDYVRETGRKSISKFNYVAWRNHAGDTKAAYRELGLGETNDSDAADYAEFLAELTNAEDLPDNHSVTHFTNGMGNGVLEIAGQSVAEQAVHHSENQKVVNTEDDAEPSPEDLYTAAELAYVPAHLRTLVGREIGIRRARKLAQEIDGRVQVQLAEEAAEEGDIAINMVTAFNAEYDDEEYTVVGLLGQGSKALFTAPAKAGKTTTMSSLVYSLSHGKPFLDHFDVPERQRVFIIDTEMTQRKHVEWLRGVNIDPELVSTAYMRGQAQR